jgi:hypothetical protein
MLDVVTKRFEKRKTQNKHGHMSNRYACLAIDDDDDNDEAITHINTNRD